MMSNPLIPQKNPKKRDNAIAQIVGQFCAEFGMDVDETVSKEYILNFFKGEKKKIQTKWGIATLPEFLEIMERENFNLGYVVKFYHYYEKRKKSQRKKKRRINTDRMQGPKVTTVGTGEHDPNELVRCIDCTFLDMGFTQNDTFPHCEIKHLKDVSQGLYRCQHKITKEEAKEWRTCPFFDQETNGEIDIFGLYDEMNEEIRNMEEMGDFEVSEETFKEIRKIEKIERELYISPMKDLGKEAKKHAFSILSLSQREENATTAKLRRYFEISGIRCSKCGELGYLESPDGTIKIPEDYGIFIVDEWEKKMDEYMGWIKDAKNEEKILNALPHLEDEWPGCCNAVRTLIRKEGR